MGTILTGAAAKIVSVTASTDLNQLLITALRDVELTYDEDASQEDVTGKGDGYATYSQGLKSGMLSFTGLYPRTSPRYGASALITIGGVTLTGVDSYKLDFDFGEEEVTAMTGAAQTARAFMPAGFPTMRGSLTCLADSAAALASVSAIHATATDLTVKLTEDGAADPGFTGSAVSLIGKLGFKTAGRGKITPSYDFVVSGQLTSVAGSTLPALLPAGTVDASDWDTNSDGSADVSIVFQNAASRTYTGNGFLKSLSIDVKVGGLIRVSGVVRFTGSITAA